MHRMLCGALLLVGCTPLDASSTLPFATVFPEDSAESAGLLDFANDPSLTLEMLENKVGIHPIAATALVTHRDGPDGTPGTFDDDHFDTLLELELRDGMGRTEVLDLFEYAWVHGWMETHVRGFDGVGFVPSQARHTLRIVNEASSDALDDALDARAVTSILDARPISGMTTLADLHFVGQATLMHLRDAPWPESDWD